ncbi:hypothetical protein B9Z55_003410 [Caenorhabditis nigoni]|nr:hypothetical protein B9Z55_003410 [Caenorhabditis nigoni]
MKILIPLLFPLFLTVNGCLHISGPSNKNCTPTDPSVFLFAYSNDLDRSDLIMYYQLTGPIYNTHRSHGLKFNVAATVRFDTKIREDIVFHEVANEDDKLFHSQNAAGTRVEQQNVDPSQRFDSSETGSDVLDMLERFIGTNYKDLCGSSALIVMSRSPNEVEISKLVTKIREYHITLNIVVRVPFSGGHRPETIYDLAAKTNGQCAFTNVVRDQAYHWMPNILNAFTYYSLNLKVSGTGTMVLPPLTLQKNATLDLGVGAQSSATAESFQNLTLSWRNSQTGTTGSFSRTREQMNQKSLNFFSKEKFLEAEAATYELTLDYNYSLEDTVLIRMNSLQPIDDWLPYQNSSIETQ